MLPILVTIIHVLVSLFLIVVVLLQSGKAADLAGAFGGMGSQTVFGPRGSATVLTRATTISAILFMVTSMTLSVLSSGGNAAPGGGGGGDILDSVSAPAGTTPSNPTTTLPGGISVELDGNGTKQTIPIPGQTPAPAPAPAPAAPKK
jgi:preprotein translocase subunit SecG